MNRPWKLKTLACCVSAALAQLAAGTAQADSAVGVDTVLGNALNPGNLRTIPVRDPEVLNSLQGQRTPTGKLHGWAVAVPETKKASGGWEYYGSAELGGIGSTGDTRSWWFNQYKDIPRAGPYLNNFYFKADNAEKGKGYFFEALGGGVGYKDQFEGISFGRYNDWKVKFFYNEIPHTFTTTYRGLWSGVGSGNLRLNGLTPGGITVPGATPLLTQQQSILGNEVALRSALNTIPNSTLAIVRHTGGATVEKYITGNWKFYGSYTQERRKGARPFGMVFGNGSAGGSAEIPESIDYNTQDILGALRFDDGKNNFNLQLNLSIFKNNISTQTTENPLSAFVDPGITDALGNPILGSVFPTARHDLYPNNNYANLRAEFARSMPEWWNSRFTATVSLSAYRQDDKLITPTTNAMTGILLNGVAADNMWNTPAALSKQSAKAAIDTRMFDLSWVMKPTEKLGIAAKFRQFQMENKTSYTACNPLTGQWGRLINDGTGNQLAMPDPAIDPTGLAYNNTGCNLAALQQLGVTPALGLWHLRNVPFAYVKTNYDLTVDYHISRAQDIHVKLGREEYQRDYQQRNRTWENVFKLTYVNRAFDWGTIRASFEYGQRRGDEFKVRNNQFYSRSLGYPIVGSVASEGWISNSNSLQKYDLADRDKLNLDLRLDWIARSDLDLGLSIQLRDNNYPTAVLGRTGHQTLGTGTVDFNWQASSKFAMYGWFTHQQSSMKQTGLQTMEGACAIGNTYSFYSDGFVWDSANGPAPVRTNAYIMNTSSPTIYNWLATCGTVSPTSPLYTSSQMYETRTQDTNDALGLGGRYDLGYARMELDYTYIRGISRVGYSYNSNSLNIFENDPNNPANLALVPNLDALVAQQWTLGSNGTPDQTYTQNILNFNVVIPVNKRFAIRFLYRFENGQISDWHYGGVSNNPVPYYNMMRAFDPAVAQNVNTVMLDQGPMRYNVNTFGLMFQLYF